MRDMRDFASAVLALSGSLMIPLMLFAAVGGILRLMSGLPRIGTQKEELPKKKLTASTVLLLIGTAFIVFASIAFVAANWNDMAAAGKVFTLLGASAVAFAISAVLNTAVKLKRTSAAFYAMGTLIASVAFVTAGYYKLFGNWFSTGGDGAMTLYGAAATIAASFAFAGYVFYKNTAMHYIGFSFAAFAVIMFCGQFPEDYSIFALSMIIVQLFMTAIVEFLNPGSEKSWGKPLKIVSRAATCVYGALALFYALTYFMDTNAYVFIILALVLVQLFFYGFFKKSRALLAAADIFAFYAAMIVSVHVEMSFGTDTAKVTFSILTLLIFAANRFIPKFDTVQRIISLASAVIGAFVSMTASVPMILQIAVPLLVAAAIAEFAFHKNVVIQYIVGVVSPIMPFFITITIFDSINLHTDYEASYTIFALCWCGYAVVCMAAAAAALFMRKICFSFYAKRPLKTQAFIYANLAAAGLALLFIADRSEISAVILGLCAIHFALSLLPKANFTALASVAAALLTAINFTSDLVSQKYVNLQNGIYVILAAVVLVASRLVFPESIIKIEKNKKISADIFLAAAWIPLVSMKESVDYFRFMQMISLSIYAAAFVKRNTSSEVKPYIFTASAITAALALISRPFLVFDSNVITSKINLFILVLLGIACKLIWREEKLVSKLVSTTIFVSSFVSLIIDGIVHDGVFNRVFVLGITALVLVLSFIGKSKTWFVASSVSLVVLTGFFMHRYIASAGWWVYLLAVGIILVTVAAVNEACRKKGENVFSTVEKKFSDWTW